MVKSFDYDEDNPKLIYVQPPVPKGVEATLRISCYAPPEITDFDDDIKLDANVEPIIIELMLYYAYGVDIEDNGTRERSNQHWQNAASLLQLYNYKQEQDMQQMAQMLRRGGR